MRNSRESGLVPDAAVPSTSDVTEDGKARAVRALAPGSNPLRAALESRGSWFLVRREYRRARMVCSLLMDRLLGVKTTPAEDDRALESATPSDLPHRPTGWLTLWRVFRRLHQCADGGAVLDVGSGAGRAPSSRARSRSAA